LVVALFEGDPFSVYHSPGWQKDYPKSQILTIGELLQDAAVDMPPPHGTFKQAQRVKEGGSEQGRLFD
jgi:hypothetical protein